MNQAQSESDSQSSNLDEELSKRDQEIASIKDQLNTAQSEKSKMEFEIKKYVSCEMFNFILVHSLFDLFHFFFEVNLRGRRSNDAQYGK